MLLAGELHRVSPQRYLTAVLTRMARILYWVQPVNPGMRYLLSSEGPHNVVPSSPTADLGLWSTRQLLVWLRHWIFNQEFVMASFLSHGTTQVTPLRGIS